MLNLGNIGEHAFSLQIIPHLLRAHFLCSYHASLEDMRDAAEEYSCLLRIIPRGILPEPYLDVRGNGSTPAGIPDFL